MSDDAAAPELQVQEEVAGGPPEVAEIPAEAAPVEAAPQEEPADAPVATEEPAPEAVAEPQAEEATEPAAPAEAEDPAARAAALAAKFAGEHAGDKRNRDGDFADGSAEKRVREDENGSFHPVETSGNMEGGNPYPASLTGHYTPMPGETVHTLHVAADKCGKIIGRAGATIKDLQGRTNTRIQVEHQANEQGIKQVHLVGMPDAVEACRALVQDVLESDNPSAAGAGGEATKTIECPQGIVGRIIGRGGETIRSLQQGSGAHILVDQNFPEGAPRQVTISGKADSVERATKMVMDLISGEPGTAQQVIQKYGVGVTRTLECPKNVVGRIIGKGGDVIKGLQKQFGASIQIDQNTNPCKITISGQTSSAMAAERAVIDIIEDRPPGGSGSMMPPYGGRPQYPPYGAPYGAPAYGGYGGYPAPGGYPSGPSYGGYQAPSAPGYGGYGGAPSYGGGYGGGYGSSAASSDPYAGYGSSGAASGGAAGYGSSHQSSSAPASSTQSPWQELRDDQGRTYYYNSQTGVSQWEKP